MSSLSDIATKWGTDKIGSDHTWFHKNYLHIYEKYFESIRHLPIRFLEIGVLGGRSLYTWREYFPNAEIHGIDINSECKRFENKDAKVFVHILDCSDEAGLAEFKNMFTNYFDVILDDGSHINNITLKTFKHLYHSVKPEGFYIIEDLICAYVGDNLLNVLQHWPGTELIQYKETKNDPNILLDFYKSIHGMIDLANRNPQYNIEYLHHYPAIVIMKKNEQYKSK